MAECDLDLHRFSPLLSLIGSDALSPDPTLSCRGDSELFTIFGDGSPGDVDSFRSKQADQVGIAVGLGAIFPAHDGADSLSDSLGADVFAPAETLDSRGKEILEFKKPLGGFSVLV
tara:strand:+ start:473 stop:820 length:348 start_codon:yes stop_codon:yes gene_type:complete